MGDILDNGNVILNLSNTWVLDPSFYALLYWLFKCGTHHIHTKKLAVLDGMRIQMFNDHDTYRIITVKYLQYQTMNPNWEWNGKVVTCEGTMPGYPPKTETIKLDIECKYTLLTMSGYPPKTETVRLGIHNDKEYVYFSNVT